MTRNSIFADIISDMTPRTIGAAILNLVFFLLVALYPVFCCINDPSALAEFGGLEYLPITCLVFGGFIGGLKYVRDRRGDGCLNAMVRFALIPFGIGIIAWVAYLIIDIFYILGLPMD